MNLRGQQIQTFEMYLASAIELALRQQRDKVDDGNLAWMLERAARGVVANWEDLTPEVFMLRYLFCVGSIQKSYKRRMDRERQGGSFWEQQQLLFRSGDPHKIVADSAKIQEAWKNAKVDLSPRMVRGMLDTAGKLVALGWEAFSDDYLLLPANAQSERFDDWVPAMNALQRLQMVGPVLAQYLLRNLYGAPFFKPDIHINHIADRFFGGDLAALAGAAKEAWKDVCPAGYKKMLRSANLGVIDYVLWNLRRLERAAEMGSALR